MMASNLPYTGGEVRWTIPSASASSSVSSYHRPRIQWLAVLLFAMSLFASAVAQLAQPTETLIVDTRVPYFENGYWTMLSRQEQEARDLRRRQPEGSPVTSSYPVTFTTSTQSSQPTDSTTDSNAADASGASTASSSASTSASSTSSVVPSSPLPSPLDSMSSNWTSSTCPTFINSFLTDAKFKQCYPFSMLLQGSRSFFAAEKSLVTITQVLDATCAANVTFCTSYFTDLAKNMSDTSNCGGDLTAGNPVVVDSYISMLAYPSLYSASCLQDTSSSMYCFASAITNLTAPSNVFVYYLPLNMSLPGGSAPTCNSCLQETMAIFQASTANRKLPIASTYQVAAQQIDTICGPQFVNESLPLATVQSGAISLRDPLGSTTWLLACAMAAAIYWLI